MELVGLSRFWPGNTAQLLVLATALCAAQSLCAADPLAFNRDVRPILNEHCLACHGPDSASRQAGLRLDQREPAINAGAITPGKLDESSMIERITSSDPDLVMPPPEIKKPLKAAHIETLKRWIAEGAEYQPHWSLIAPTKPAPPQVANSWWVRNPIDQFIAAKLEQAKLAPATEADRRTLARRVSFDLTGLASSPAEVEAFVNDPRPDAYERFVERLLASPRWGEHRGRYWLDVARYADTHGIHFDNYREMWRYRQWVIEAFNQNLPYDEFTIKNLAGDLLPNATLEDQIASGFNRCNITTSEGGAINEEYEVLYTRDRTETTSIAWMGITAGCAVCHDHKFDAISQREFYELSAFFNNTTQAAMDGNVKDTPPVVFVPTEADRAAWDALPGQLEQTELELTAHRQRHEATPPAEFTAWQQTVSAGEIISDEKVAPPAFHAPLNEGTKFVKLKLDGKEHDAELSDTVKWETGPLGKPAAIITKGRILEEGRTGAFTGAEPYTVAMWVKLPATADAYCIVSRLDDGKVHQGWDIWVENRRLGGHLIHSWDTNAVKVMSKDQLPTNEWIQIVYTYDASRKGAGFHLYVNGAEVMLETLNDRLVDTTETKASFRIGQRSVGGAAENVGITDLRLYKRELSAAEAAALNRPGLLDAVSKAPAERTPEELTALSAWWLEHHDAEYQALFATRAKLQQDLLDMRKRGASTHVMNEKDTPAMAYVLNRGEYDQHLDEVKPNTPAMFPPMPSDLPRNRLGLAKWLLRDDHPLTTRVSVNRFWQEVFGTGLVRTAGDFGVTGETPSHPELLDWLAVTFREQGWDVKQLFRLMVTSSTYRQAAITTPEKRERDGDNRLLSRGPRFRMDAEMVRDHALATCALLVEKIGGPSVKPYQPPGVWEAVAMTPSNTRYYKEDKGESLYRRSLYTFWKRSAPPASLDIFNAPNRESCVMLRERTNTPMQALVTLNDPQYVEAARTLAESLCENRDSSTTERLAEISERLLSRRLTPEETAIIERSLTELQKHYEAKPEAALALIEVGERPTNMKLPPAEVATWTMIVSELMNLDENVTK